jgi:hypothetical protein
MAKPKAAVKETPVPLTKPVKWIEVELGDTDFTVTEHPDGMFTIEFTGARLVVNAEQLRSITDGFITLAREKFWLQDL